MARYQADGWSEVQAEDYDLDKHLAVVRCRGGSWVMPWWIFEHAFKEVKDIGHFDAKKLMEALGVWYYGHNGWWSLNDAGYAGQSLDGTKIVEFVAGKMLDPAVRQKVLEAAVTRKAPDGH